MTVGACDDRAQMRGSGLQVTLGNGSGMRGRRGRGARAGCLGVRLSLMAGERSKGLG